MAPLVTTACLFTFTLVLQGGIAAASQKRLMRKVLEEAKPSEDIDAHKPSMRSVNSKLSPQNALMPKFEKAHDHGDMKIPAKGDLMQLTHQGSKPKTSERKAAAKRKKDEEKRKKDEQKRKKDEEKQKKDEEKKAAEKAAERKADDYHKKLADARKFVEEAWNKTEKLQRGSEERRLAKIDALSSVGKSEIDTMKEVEIKMTNCRTDLAADRTSLSERYEIQREKFREEHRILEEQIGNMTINRTMVEKDVANLAQQIQSIQKQQQKRAQAIQKLTQQLADKKQAIQGTDKKKASLKKERNSLIKERKALQKENQKGEVIQNLTQQLADKNQAIQGTDKKRKSLIQERKSLDKKKQALQTKYNKVRPSFDQKKRELDMQKSLEKQWIDKIADKNSQKTRAKKDAIEVKNGWRKDMRHSTHLLSTVGKRQREVSKKLKTCLEFWLKKDVFRWRRNCNLDGKLKEWVDAKYFSYCDASL